MFLAIIRAFGIVALCAFAAAGVARADEAGEIDRLFMAGQASEAFARLDKLLADNPRDPQWRFLKGVLLAQSKRASEAAAVFTQLSVDYPEMPEPYNNLAVIHAERGEFDKAQAALESALRANPSYAVAQQNLGDVHVQLARLSYERALELNPADGTIAPKLRLLRGLVEPAAASRTQKP